MKIKALGLVGLLLLAQGAFANQVIKNEMSAIGKAYKDLKTRVGDPAQAAAVAKEVDAMIASTAKIKAEVPDTANKPGLQGQARDQFLLDYAASADGLAKKLNELKAASLAGDMAAAKAAYAALEGIRNDGHKQFK